MGAAFTVAEKEHRRAKKSIRRRKTRVIDLEEAKGFIARMIYEMYNDR